MGLQRVVARSIATVACLAIVAGCSASQSGSADEPAADAPAAAAPAVDGPSVPAAPPETKGTSPAAAQAFVRYWVEALNYAGRTGRTLALRAATAPQCSACQELITGIEQVHGEGGYYTEDLWSLDSIDYRPLHPEEQPVLSVDIKVHSGDKAGSAPPDSLVFDAGAQSVIVWLGRNRTADNWVVRDMERAS